MWGPSAPSKGRFAAPWGVDPQIYISLDSNLYEQYAYQIQAAESALALWVAMQNPVSQMYDNTGLAEFLGPDV